MVEYRDNGEYTLTAIGDEGKAGTPVQASCWAEEVVVAEGEEEGAELDGDNLVMTGFLGEKRVVANIATVDNKLHIFTNVSSLSLSHTHTHTHTLKGLGRNIIFEFEYYYDIVSISGWSSSSEYPRARVPSVEREGRRWRDQVTKVPLHCH